MEKLTKEQKIKIGLEAVEARKRTAQKELSRKWTEDELVHLGEVTSEQREKAKETDKAKREVTNQLWRKFKAGEIKL